MQLRLGMGSRVARAAAALAALALAAGCSGGGSSPTAPTPPPPALSLTCPSDVSAESPDGQPVAVVLPTVTRTGGLEPVTVTCATPEGSRFPVGETTVECRASDTALQQASCSYKVTVTRQPRLTQTNIVAFGDSMTAGVVSDAPAGLLSTDGYPAFLLNLRPSASYPSKLQTRLRERYKAQGSSVAVTNLGVPGEKAEDGARRMQDVMLILRPPVVLLMHGANNFTGVTPSSRTFVINRLSDMAREARLRGAKVFIASLPPPRPSGRNAIALSTILDYNHNVRLLTQGEGATFVDVYAVLAADVNRYIGEDGLHPTEAGYDRMALEFYEAIRRELEEK